MPVNIFLVPAITGALFLVAGWIMLKYPPKKINILYGYRTATSMRSKETWDFAQSYSARRMMRSGALLMLLSLSGCFLNFNVKETTGAIFGLAIIMVFVVVPIIQTERALKKHFPKP